MMQTCASDDGDSLADLIIANHAFMKRLGYCIHVPLSARSGHAFLCHIRFRPRRVMRKNSLQDQPWFLEDTLQHKFNCEVQCWNLYVACNVLTALQSQFVHEITCQWADRQETYQ